MPPPPRPSFYDREFEVATLCDIIRQNCIDFHLPPEGESSSSEESDEDEHLAPSQKNKPPEWGRARNPRGTSFDWLIAYEFLKVISR